jgi:hypothetical protein
MLNVKEKVVCLKLNLRVIDAKDVVIFGCLENTERKILSSVQNVKVHTGIDLEKQKVRNDRLFPVRQTTFPLLP